MNREEAIVEYKNKVCINICEKYKKEFYKALENNIDKLQEVVIESLKTVILECNDNREEDYNIAVFQFELLRSNILMGNYKIWLHGYNHMWFLDQNSIVKEVDLDFLFNTFISLKEELNKEKKIYLGKINNYDIQEIIFETITECYLNMDEYIRSILWDLDEKPWFEENLKSQFYIIKWTEYQGKGDTVFAMDNKVKGNEDILERLKKPKEKGPLVYSVWKDSSFKDISLKECDMLFINFKGSTFEGIDFSGSDIVRGELKNCKFINCNFSNTRLVGSNFEDSIIKNCSFENSLIVNVDFSKANISRVNFSNSDLSNSLFVQSDFDEVIFEGAKVDDTVFNLKYIPFIHLSSEQLQRILIEGES